MSAQILFVFLELDAQGFTHSPFQFKCYKTDGIGPVVMQGFFDSPNCNESGT